MIKCIGGKLSNVANQQRRYGKSGSEMMGIKDTKEASEKDEKDDYRMV
jgi:hypothetical protein